MQLPRLIALVSNVGGFDKGLHFPLEVWRGLEYFKPSYDSHIGLRSDYFRNLRHLSLILISEGVDTYREYFPFHELECLTVQSKFAYTSGTDVWKQRAELVVGLPLDVKAMPKLKLFQLDWTFVGTYEFYCQYLNCAERKDRFLRYFETLTARFEQRGVLFAETNDREICPGFQPIRDVLNMCKQS